MDVHGDEAIAANFLAGFEGIPSLKQAQQDLFDAFSAALLRASPDFQTDKGYQIPGPGQANLSMSTAQLAERFGAVSMTLEMPFKDNAELPDPVYGWSTDRCRLLARASLDALHASFPGWKPIGREASGHPPRPARRRLRICGGRLSRAGRMPSQYPEGAVRPAPGCCAMPGRTPQRITAERDTFRARAIERGRALGKSPADVAADARAFHATIVGPDAHGSEERMEALGDSCRQRLAA